ncbi:MAG TPA: hypothetical protein VF329_04840 [Gammaproteobacteria bacterium]
MSLQEPALVTLGTRLCPWLAAPLERLETARRSERLGHAWLIHGPAGTGKLNLALVFAHRLLSGTESAPPDLDAEAAAAAMRERRAPGDHHPDLHFVFPQEDKRTIGIEQIRDLSQSLTLKGFRGAAKVAVVEPAEAMTVAAANALLKTLEEPAEQTYLLLISHQPDRLLPTIRSRCQGLAVEPPPSGIAAEWLGLDPSEAHPVLLVSGRAPLQAVELMDPEKLAFLNNLEEQLDLISQSKLDPKAVAEEWVRKDVEQALCWLIRRLEHAIRERSASGAHTTAVTPPGGARLHNAWLVLPVRALFERRDAAEKLLDRLGSGINVELALHALLLDFRLERGRRT